MTTLLSQKKCATELYIKYTSVLVISYYWISLPDQNFAQRTTTLLQHLKWVHIIIKCSINKKQLKQILRNVELYFAKIWHQIDISTNLWQIFIFENDIRSISLQAKFEIALILDEIGKTEPENQLGIEEKNALKPYIGVCTSLSWMSKSPEFSWMNLKLRN